MKPYKKLYLDFFGYDCGDYIPSEVSGLPGTDYHHLQHKGMGGSKSKDFIENISCLTRKEHDRCHNDKDYNHEVQIRHLEYIRLKRPDYDMRPEYNELLKQHYLNEKD